MHPISKMIKDLLPQPISLPVKSFFHLKKTLRLSLQICTLFSIYPFLCVQLAGDFSGSCPQVSLKMRVISKDFELGLNIKNIIILI
jgi:hypothetical protein